MRIGANYLGNRRCEFSVWGPFLESLEVKVMGAVNESRYVPMERDFHGYWNATVEGMAPGTRYLYRLNGGAERPDPVSHSQPEGVEGPSEVVDHTFDWTDGEWKGIPLPEMIIYEIHTGTFTPEGTFDSIIPRLDRLKELGINAIELMPVSQFPGERNWGYDGVFHYAVQNTYGGPDGLKRLVDECHRRGIAVILDVVYNHFGPEGNYISEFGPYFTEKYKTPWGDAINFDGPYSDEVRNFFIENSAHWFGNYHIDALRLDAIHAIYDFSARPFLKSLRDNTKILSDSIGRPFYLIAESDLNDPAVIKDEGSGYGLDAVWCDDFHHSLRTLFSGEKTGYYQDFGRLSQLLKSLREGFVYTGQYSRYRKKCFGESSRDVPKDRFIVFSQNHDQVGNSMLGERLSALLPFGALKLIAGATILSPYIPLLFMGEEYGELAPFLYFINHTDEALIEATRRGRMEEFREFHWQGEPPAPDSPDTFLKCKLRWEDRDYGTHKVLLDFYKKLIRMRKSLPAFSKISNGNFKAAGFEAEKAVLTMPGGEEGGILTIYNFNRLDITLPLDLREGVWRKEVDSADAAWEGPGSDLPESIEGRTEIGVKGFSMAVYLRRDTDG